MYWEEWKTKNFFFTIFSFWDMVDLKCEKCGLFFVRFRWTIFSGTNQTILRIFFLHSGKNIKNKDVEIFYWNAVERKPVPTKVLIPKASGAWARSLRWRVQGGEAHRRKKMKKKFNIFFKKLMNIFSSNFFFPDM